MHSYTELHREEKETIKSSTCILICNFLAAEMILFKSKAFYAEMIYCLHVLKIRKYTEKTQKKQKLGMIERYPIDLIA